MTFESNTQAPKTIRGEVSGALAAAAGRAVRTAWKQKPTRNRFVSVVILLEKLSSPEEPGEDPEEMGVGVM